MGYKIVDAVIDSTHPLLVARPLTRLTLIKFARHADNDGTGAYPARPTVARFVGREVKTVDGYVKRLKAAGLLQLGDQTKVAHLPAGSRPVVYNIDLETLTAHPTSVGRGDTHDAPADAPQKEGRRPRPPRGETHIPPGAKPTGERGDVGVALISPESVHESVNESGSHQDRTLEGISGGQPTTPTPAPGSPHVPEGDKDSLRIDVDGSIHDPELSRLRTRLEGLRARYDQIVDASLAEIAKMALPPPNRANFVRSAREWASRPEDVVGAYMVALDAAENGATVGTFRVGRTKLTEGRLPIPSRSEDFSSAQRWRDALSTLDRQITEVERQVAERNAMCDRASGIIRGLLTIKKAGGVESWMDSFASQVPRLRSILAETWSARHALVALGLSAVATDQLINRLQERIEFEEAAAIARADAERVGRHVHADPASIVTGLDFSDPAEPTPPQLVEVGERVDLPHTHAEEYDDGELALLARATRPEAQGHPDAPPGVGNERREPGRLNPVGGPV